MEKVKIDPIPPADSGLITLKASIALILAKSMSIMHDTKYDPEEFMDSAEQLIEILGEEDAKLLTLRQEHEPTILQFKLRPEEILNDKKTDIIIKDVDETPWYNRFLDMRDSKKKWKFENHRNKPIQKRTRNKWFLVSFFINSLHLNQ